MSAEQRLADLFQAHQTRLFRTALRLSRNREDAQDLVQETFVRAARRVHSLPATPEVEGWLIRTLVNLSKDRWRRRRVRRRPVPDWPGDEVSNPESGSVARLTVRSALQELSPTRRVVVALVDLEGLSSREAGELLGLRPATIRWHLAKAHATLARLIDTGDEVPQ